MSSTAAETSAAATAQPTSTILHDPNTRRINALQVTVALSLTYSVLNVVIRVWIRRGFYGLDDLIAVVAMVRPDPLGKLVYGGALSLAEQRTGTHEDHNI